MKYTRQQKRSRSKKEAEAEPSLDEINIRISAYLSAKSCITAGCCPWGWLLWASHTFMSCMELLSGAKNTEMAATEAEPKFSVLWASKGTEALNFVSCIYQNWHTPGRVNVLCLSCYLHSLLEREYWVNFQPRHLSRKGNAGSWCQQSDLFLNCFFFFRKEKTHHWITVPFPFVSDQVHPVFWLQSSMGTLFYRAQHSLFFLPKLYCVVFRESLCPEYQEG